MNESSFSAVGGVVVALSLPAINRFKADLREMSFLLFEQFRVGELLGHAPYEEWSADEIRAALVETAKFAREVLGPLHARGDAEGCTLTDGGVTTPTGFKDAWARLRDAGWKSVGVEREHGGGGAPRMLDVLIEELLSGANIAFEMYPGLGVAVAELVAAFGTAEQRARFCPSLFHQQWGGTMCLTEPQAGSDVGAARCRATRNPDGTYAIKGTKIFISAGDHDLTDNIIHMVLARVEGAPAGTKGLTLFIVPKRRVAPDGTSGAPNDVAVGSIEHKMGLNGSSTCVLNFGENDGCIGEPLGGEAKLNQGMAQMFKMMNTARIGVGVQGLAVASTAYLNALEYARERKQGASIENWKDPNAPRVPLIEHPDVRRMLLDMKARVEGIRALAMKLVHHQDMVRVLAGRDDAQAAYHQGQTDLLVPLIKAYGSDQGFRVCETAIQTFGGAGYTKDHPVEQYCRDAKIFSIYEGTNHIQAMDLVGRKLGQAGGANLQAFVTDVQSFAANHAEDPKLGAACRRLGTAIEAVMGAAMRLMMWFQSGQAPLVPLAANRFLEMMAETAVAWLLLEGAAIAQVRLSAMTEGSIDDAFYRGKLQAALYYARNVLPGVLDKSRLLEEEDRSPLEIPDDGFATI
jgi:alkylation response protein AidB-like acyl-CoA dehydrogenase